jgi:molecular chaperone DnaJ
VISKINIINILKTWEEALVLIKIIIDPFGGGFGGFSGQGFDGAQFKDIFENMEEFFGGAGGRPERSKKGKDVVVNVEITFMESIQGCQKTVTFDRVTVCNTCNGSKCRPGTSPSQCTQCGGSGKVFYKQGFMSIAMECASCQGEGSRIVHPCTTCYGKGYMNINSKENINIPKGVDDNNNLRLQKKGHYSSNGQHGDLYVKIKIKPHTYFKREQFDIYTTNYITISQAVLGGKVKVKTLYGDISVNIDPGTNDGDTKKLLNYVIHL